MLQALQDEMKARQNKAEQLCEVGRQLISDKHPSSAEIQSRINSLQEQWNTLLELVALRRKQLEDAAEAYQVGGLHYKTPALTRYELYIVLYFSIMLQWFYT
jgi:hypothetical protein